MHRTLIVARMNLTDAEGVASVFADSDSTELPHMVGVSRRTLFAFHDLYFHLVEAEQDIAPNLYKARSHPLYDEINTRLGRYISPYDPHWREPKDAMAVPFYSWTPAEGPLITAPTGANLGGGAR
ncbi:TcmI family type II polyketide cyclase [Streptomyces sp. NPDC007861]|uniref:TcmI family type II polyketide cyclase n=1 Tax=Streptomyces sp. NPDC007861 TaxID=3154893 RepID=UPI0033CBC3D7